MFRIFGIEPTVEGLTLEEYRCFIHPDDLAVTSRTMENLFANADVNEKREIDYRIIRRDGSVRILHSQRQVKELTPDGKPKIVIGVDQDVTDQKEAEEALRRSEDRFRVVAEAANIMVYETDIGTGKIRILRGLEQLVGYKPEEVDITVDWVVSRMHPEDVPHVMGTYNDVANNPYLDKYVLEYRFLHKNGHYITVKDTAKAVKDTKGKAILFVGGIRDITQRRCDQEKIRQYSKRLEELVEERTKQLIAYERFAAIGQVAGMVGHDIRNPLQALTSETYLLKTDLSTLPNNETTGDMKECLSSIEQNIGYINKIIADLQDYSRQLEPDYTKVDLAELITQIFETIVVPSNIQLVFNVKSLPKLKCDSTFIRRALTNLINNAIQAMPNGGKLEIGGYQKEDRVYITVADTGVGISEEAKSKLFTPMFTTKTKGQGLGLAVVKRLVEAQKGSICFESTVGKGTTFTIRLPL
jgi:PAS domain S-box-containing protein